MVLDEVDGVGENVVLVEGVLITPPARKAGDREPNRERTSGTLTERDREVVEEAREERSSVFLAEIGMK